MFILYILDNILRGSLSKVSQVFLSTWPAACGAVTLSGRERKYTPVSRDVRSGPKVGQICPKGEIKYGTFSYQISVYFGSLKKN